VTEHTTLFERAWSDREDGEPLLWGDGEVEPVLAELRLADGLRATGASVVQPDWEAAWDELVVRLAEPAVPVGLDVRRREPLARARLARAGVALVAALSLIGGAAMVSAGASPGSLLYPVRKAVERGVLVFSPSDRGLLVRIAEARLEDLLIALGDRQFDLVAGLATDLVKARQAALNGGGEVSRLDRAIAERVPPALAGAPAGVRRTVEAVLGELLPAGSLGKGAGRGSPAEPAFVRGTPDSVPKDEHKVGAKGEDPKGTGGNEEPDSSRSTTDDEPVGTGGAAEDDEAQGTAWAAEDEAEPTGGATEEEPDDAGAATENEPEATGGAAEDDSEGTSGAAEDDSEGTSGAAEDDEAQGTGGAAEDEAEPTGGEGGGADGEDSEGGSGSVGEESDVAGRGEDEAERTGGADGEEPEDTEEAEDD
jgi:hypothetical protein